MTSRPTNIFRREHTRGYTVITNEVLNDARLALDEKGLLCWFLSRPHDWEVIPAQVRKAHKIGRDKFYRLVAALVANGYVRREKVRADDGTIACTRYVVTDDPGPPQAIEDGEMDAEGDAEPPIVVAPESTVASLQQPEKPDTADPDTVYQHAVTSNDIIQTTPLPPKAEPAEVPKAADNSKPSFQVLLGKWPPDSVLSLFASERAFLRLDPGRQRAAVDRVQGYLASIRSKGWKVCDLATYLRDRRFEKVIASASVTAWPIRAGTPQAYRWLEYKRAMGEKTSFIEERWRTGQPVHMPSEWPPPAKGPGERTMPQQSPSSPETETEYFPDLAREMGG